MLESTPPLVPQLSDADVIRLVGMRAAQRGLSYARSGRVLEATSEDAGGDDGASDGGAVPELVLRGRVAGSDRRPYRVEVVMVADAGGARSTVERAQCTCPVGERCKHTAALLYHAVVNAARRDATEIEPGLVAHEPAASNARGARPRGGASALASPPRAGRRSAPSWRATFDGLLHPTSGGTEPLAIGVEPFIASRFGFSQYGMRPATADDLEAGAPAVVTLRPLRPGARGGWIRGQLTWRTFRDRFATHAYRPAHVDALGRIVGLVLADHSYRYDAGESIRLDELGADGWTLLRHAVDCGVALVARGPLHEATLGTPASARLDVRRAGGDLTVAPLVERDGRRFDAPFSVGTGGFAHLRRVDGRGKRPSWACELVPAITPLTPALVALLASGRETLVPARDVDEFLHEVAPMLRRVVDVSSEAGDVDIPDVAPPRLVIEVEHTTVTPGGAPCTLVAASWAYHAPTRRLPLRADEGGDAAALTHPDRDVATEAATLASVREVWPGIAPTPQPLADIEAAEFVTSVLPLLSHLDGVDVRERGERPDYTAIGGEPHLRITQVEPARASDRDWLELGFEITLDGQLVPFTAIFTALSKGKKAVLLPDGRYAKLDHPDFDRLRELIAEAEAMGEWTPERPRIARYDVTLWDDFEDLADESVEAVSWRGTVGALRDLDSIPRVEPPAGLAATLRPYQREGLDWLAFLHEHGLGGILGDDMGLGKTVQTLGLIARAREREPDARPFLVIAPSSVLGVWRGEAERFVPGLDTRILDATAAKRGTALADAVRGADLVVTSYTLLRLDDEAFAALDWSGLVLDEAQFVKNRAAKTHQAAAAVRAPFRLAITGTPMENSLTDLWALLSLTAPGLFASPRRFRDEYVRPIEQAGGGDDERRTAETRMARLRRRVRPFLLRRAKSLVASELPPKHEQRLDVALAPAHRRLYDRILQRERQKLLRLVRDDFESNRFIVFRSLTLLRLLALDPVLIGDEHASVPSSKLDALMEQLPEAIAEGHRVIVFSQFTSYLARIAERLDAAGIAHAYLDGSTRNRDAAVAEFRDGGAPVFLISLKAGGFGLTLTEADYVYVMDPWWNPAAESQAVDRAHRIGQLRPVTVYRMVAEGTIEARVLALQERKAKLFDALTDGEAAFSGAVTADDVRELLGAL